MQFAIGKKSYCREIASRIVCQREHSQKNKFDHIRRRVHLPKHSTCIVCRSSEHPDVHLIVARVGGHHTVQLCAAEMDASELGRQICSSDASRTFHQQIHSLPPRMQSHKRIDDKNRLLSYGSAF